MAPRPRVAARCALRARARLRDAGSACGDRRFLAARFRERRFRPQKPVAAKATLVGPRRTTAVPRAHPQHAPEAPPGEAAAQRRRRGRTRGTWPAQLRRRKVERSICAAAGATGAASVPSRLSCQPAASLSAVQPRRARHARLTRRLAGAGLARKEAAPSSRSPAQRGTRRSRPAHRCAAPLRRVERAGGAPEAQRRCCGTRSCLAPQPCVGAC